MSDEKRARVDPKTGEEIESTPLARLVTAVPYVLLFALASVVVCFVLHREEEPWSCITAVCIGHLLVVTWVTVGERSWRATCGTHTRVRRVHDAIARWQHRRREARE